MIDMYYIYYIYIYIYTYIYIYIYTYIYGEKNTHNLFKITSISLLFRKASEKFLKRRETNYVCFFSIYFKNIYLYSYI